MKARVLLGWMTVDAAVELLQRECRSPMGRTEAESLWAERRAYVLAMAPREPSNSLLPVTRAEDLAHAVLFDSYLRARSSAAEAVRVDLLTLCVRQLVVLVEHPSQYGSLLRDECAWNEIALPTKDSHSTIQVTGAVQGLGGAWQVELPHGEFHFACDADGAFRVNERMRYVSVARLQDRTVLWAGYHRVFAKIANALPDARAEAMVACIPSPLELRAAIGATDPYGLHGTRAPVMADFFNPHAYVDVDVREKKYVMEIRAQPALV